MSYTPQIISKTFDIESLPDLDLINTNQDKESEQLNKDIVEEIDKRKK